MGIFLQRRTTHLYQGSWRPVTAGLLVPPAPLWQGSWRPLPRYGRAPGAPGIQTQICTDPLHEPLARYGRAPGASWPVTAGLLAPPAPLRQGSWRPRHVEVIPWRGIKN